MSLDWYPWHVRDFKRDTLHLTLAQDGAYRRLIDEYMTTEGPLPNNDVALARVLGVSLDEWMAVASVVREFFNASNNKLVHKRCEQELSTQRMRDARRSQAASVAATARHKRDKENREIIANRMPSAHETDASVVRSSATLHYKDRPSSKAAREASPVEKQEKPEQLDGSLATALPAGALRSPSRSSIPVSPQLAAQVQERGWTPPPGGLITAARPKTTQS